MKKIAITFLFFVVLIIVWQVGEGMINEDRLANGDTALEAFIPSPSVILYTFRIDGLKLLKESFYTLEKAGIGFLLGTIVAIIMSSTFLFVPVMRNMIYPVSFAINSFPIVGLAPAVILAFGQGSWFSIVFISALICYFPIFISLDSVFRNTNRDLSELMQVLNASKWQVLTKVKIPLAMPYLLLSMKLAIPASIIGAMMGEWLGARNGIGQIITIALYQLKPGLLYAALILIMLMSVGIVAFFSFLERYLFPWFYESNEKKK